MMPPSNLAVRVVVEENPDLVRKLNANYAGGAPDGSPDAEERDAVFDVLSRHFTGKSWPRSGGMDAVPWRAILLIGVIIIAGCHSRRPDFLTRVNEDCTAGDQWACDLLDALRHSKPANENQPPENVKDDSDAILRGIHQARPAPRLGYPIVPPVAIGLQI
jgi:hypothetical protein